MTEHDDKQVASVDAMANAEPSKGRRRLVKGLIIGTPAIMTISHNTFAQAITSLGYQEGLDKLCNSSFVIRDGDNNLIGVNVSTQSYSSFINRWGGDDTICGVPPPPPPI